MAKKNTLNGIPGNMANSYLSTLGYFDGGYAADWIYHIAVFQNINEINIDVINGMIEPKQASIKPLTFDLLKLKEILDSEIISNGFESSFIKTATLKFEVDKSAGKVFCDPELRDIDGKIYKPKRRISEHVARIKNFENKLSTWK